jgi:hypothetical protein
MLPKGANLQKIRDDKRTYAVTPICRADSSNRKRWRNMPASPGNTAACLS